MRSSATPTGLTAAEVVASRAAHGGRAFFSLSGCGGFLSIALLILVGQVAIVSFGGRMFGVVPLALSDWVLVFLLTAAVPLVARALTACGAAFLPRGSSRRRSPRHPNGYVAPRAGELEDRNLI